MTCREFIQVLDDYLVEALGPEKAALCEEHLNECPYCRDYLKTYQATIDLMKRALAAEPEVELPQEVASDVLRALEALRRSPGH
jgi:predicted anti-sigma-YlaC factor YlaD